MRRSAAATPPETPRDPLRIDSPLYLRLQTLIFSLPIWSAALVLGNSQYTRLRSVSSLSPIDRKRTDSLKVGAEQLAIKLRRKRVRRTANTITICSARQSSPRASEGERTEGVHERDQHTPGLDEVGVAGSPFESKGRRECAEEGVVVCEGETARGDQEGEKVESFAVVSRGISGVWCDKGRTDNSTFVGGLT